MMIDTSKTNFRYTLEEIEDEEPKRPLYEGRFGSRVWVAMEKMDDSGFVENRTVRPYSVYTKEGDSPGVADEEKLTLIDEVKSNRDAWDVKSPMFKNKIKAVQLWKRIGEEVNTKHGTNFDGNSAKAQFKKLKDCFFFRVKKQLQNPKTGSGADEVTVRWRFFHSLEFLLANVDTGMRVSNVASRSSDTGEPTTNSTSSSIRQPKEMDFNSSRKTQVLPSRKRSDISTHDAVTMKLCQTLDNVNSDRTHEADGFEAFGNFATSTLREAHANDPRRAKQLKVKMMKIPTEYEEDELYGRI